MASSGAPQMDAAMSCHHFTHAILRTPGRSVVGGLHAGGGPRPDYDAVLREHAAYADALRAAGLTIDILDPIEAFPDSIFVEDPALVFGEGAILLNPGADTRRGEVEEIAPALHRHFGDLHRVTEGYADGGDVMVTPDRVLIGLSARTDAVGAQALVEVLGRLGRKAEVVDPPREALHLKTIATLIDEETILTTPAGAASGLFAGFRTIVLDADEAPAANALRINETLLLSDGFPRIAERLDREGYRLKLLDTAHVARIDAGLSCMSLRWNAAQASR
ncbi:arginine deiminase family protein [Sphingomonas sp. AOB5]|uniref:arginine deiminase family protein n=1 Tax=Sphingomonas sp. AOB5 TaxID=3034017 RepID=UPI0023F7016A|nr:arginine deiminase family protein [Sphingomonas sp. AOB5]MDF7777330.1 arginine deiminase family protein [Sphingomonas sp. AOB5]